LLYLHLTFLLTDNIHNGIINLKAKFLIKLGMHTNLIRNLVYLKILLESGARNCSIPFPSFYLERIDHRDLM
jgi:hypothetical protein